MLIDLTNSPTRPGATVDLLSPVAELKRPASDVAESDVAAAASRGPSPKKQMTDGVKSGKAVIYTSVASPSCGPASGASRTVPQRGSSIEPLLLS